MLIFSIAVFLSVCETVKAYADSAGVKPDLSRDMRLSLGLTPLDLRSLGGFTYYTPHCPIDHNHQLDCLHMHNRNSRGVRTAGDQSRGADAFRPLPARLAAHLMWECERPVCSRRNPLTAIFQLASSSTGPVRIRTLRPHACRAVHVFPVPVGSFTLADLRLSRRSPQGVRTPPMPSSRSRWRLLILCSWLCTSVAFAL